MGNPKVYGPQLPQMPADMTSARSGMLNWLLPQLGQEGKAYPGTLSPAAPFDLNQLLGGLGYGNKPGATGAGGGNWQDTLNQLMKTGLPTDVNPAYQATLSQAQQRAKDEIAQSMQAANAGNTRYGTGAMRQTADITGRTMTDWGSMITQLAAQLQESARQRQLSAAGLSGDLAAKMGMLGIQRAGTAAGIAMPYWQMLQNQAQTEYGAWQSRQPGYRPETQMLFNYGQNYPFSAQQPAVADNPWMSLLMSLVGAGGDLGAAKILAA